MFQDFANTLEGAEVEVYYYWLTLLLSNMLLRFLVFPGIFREMIFYQVVGRKVQEGETINHDISGEENNTRTENSTTSSSYIKTIGKTQRKSKLTNKVI